MTIRSGVMIDSGPPELRTWPTREQWAEQRTTAYSDDYRFETLLAQRLSGARRRLVKAEEVLAAHAALQAAYKRLGRELKEAKGRIPADLQRRPGETGSAYNLRFLQAWRAATEAEKDILAEPDALRN